MTVSAPQLPLDLGVPHSRIAAVNVAEVPQRSPLRYPGGKTWLIPHIREWLNPADAPGRLLIEPFAGGGTVSLTTIMEQRAERALMIELDPDVAAFWQAALQHGPALIELVRRFEPTRESVAALDGAAADDVLMRGFRTLALNRVRRGGILAPGASLSRSGENGKGLRSRWYPDTLVRRLAAISEHAGRSHSSPATARPCSARSSRPRSPTPSCFSIRPTQRAASAPAHGSTPTTKSITARSSSWPPTARRTS